MEKTKEFVVSESAVTLFLFATSALYYFLIFEVVFQHSKYVTLVFIFGSV